MTGLEMAALGLVIAPIPGWLCTAILVRASRALDEPSLHERAVAALLMSTATTCVAVVSAAYLGKVDLNGVGTAILVGGLFLVNVPQIVWGVAYLRGRFR